MIWEATDKGVLTLLVSNAKAELKVGVDLAEKVLELGLADEKEGFGVIVDIPDVVAVEEVSTRRCIEVMVTYRSHSRVQNLPSSKNADAMS